MKKWSLLVCLMFLGGGAFAAERIRQFAVSVNVGPDGRAWVTEEISVVAEHKQIRRGIYRDIPSTRKEPIKILGLEMDGAPHPFFTERNGKDLRVNFGDDSFIPRGPHTYRLTYTMDNAVRFFPAYDEIYWNVTGNY